MPNEVNVSFIGDDKLSGTVQTVPALIDRIKQAAASAGQVLDKSLVHSMDGWSPRALQEFHDQLRGIETQAVKTGEAIKGVNAAGGSGQLRLRGDFSGLGTGAAIGGTGVGGAPKSVGSITEADAFKFREQQVAFERQRRRVTQDFAQIETGANKAGRAVDLVGKGLTSLVGVPKSEAISQLVGSADQLQAVTATLGSTGGKLLAIAPAAGIAAAGVFLLTRPFVSIRENAEKALAAVERLSVVNRTGLQGGAGQTKSELEQLRQVRDDVRKLIGAGDQSGAQSLIEGALGKGAGALTLESRFQQSLDRARRLGVDTTDPAIIERQKKAEEARKKEIGDFNELNRLRLDSSNREFEAQQRSLQLTREAGREVQNLRGQLTDNPFARIYDQAADRQAQFLERFKEVPQTIKSEFLKLNQDLQNLDIFKANLARTDRLNSLIADRERLQNRGVAGRFFNEFGAPITQEEANAQLESRLRGSQITSAQSALAGATGPAQQQLALDRILQATSDTSRLTEEQAQIRLRAIEQRIEIEPAALAEKQKTEADLVASQKELTPAMLALAEAIAKGITLNFNVKDSPSTESSVRSEPSPFNR